MDPLVVPDEIEARRQQLTYRLATVDLHAAGHNSRTINWTILSPPVNNVHLRPSPYVWVVHMIKYTTVLYPDFDWLVIDEWTCGQVLRALVDYESYCQHTKRVRAFRSLLCYSCPELLWLCLHLAVTLSVPNRPALPPPLRWVRCPGFSIASVYARFFRTLPPILTADGRPFQHHFQRRKRRHQATGLGSSHRSAFSPPSSELTSVDEPLLPPTTHSGTSCCGDRCATVSIGHFLDSTTPSPETDKSKPQ